MGIRLDSLRMRFCGEIFDDDDDFSGSIGEKISSPIQYPLYFWKSY
jgi:hypothetical protein